MANFVFDIATPNPKIEEILKDIESLKYADNNEKKEIAKKYNIYTNKKSEIETFLWFLANEERKGTETFTQTDFRVWNNAFGYPSQYKKMKEALEGESLVFIKKLHKYFESKFNSMAYVKDNRYKVTEKIIYEIENAASIKKEEDRTKMIYDRLVEPTKPFKSRLYNRYIESETFRFERAKNLYEEYKNLTTEEKRKQKCASWILNIMVLSDNFDWATYYERINKDFESMFTNNLMHIATAINNNRKVNINHLKLYSINEDPKYFEMGLRDCHGNFIHARSIIAAEYSEKVSTHYRFIVTINKKSKPE